MKLLPTLRDLENHPSATPAHLHRWVHPYVQDERDQLFAHLLQLSGTLLPPNILLFVPKLASLAWCGCIEYAAEYATLHGAAWADAALH
jgi:hypothetical protein